MRIYHRGGCLKAIASSNKVKHCTYAPKLIVKYKFDKSICEDLIPEFNTGYNSYEIVDEYLNTEDIVTTTTETIMIMNHDAELDEYGVLTTEHEVENVSTFSAENIVTRTIYSNELPTKVQFGAGPGIASSERTSCLLEVLYLETRNLTTMESLFDFCINLSKVNTVGWNTSKVTNMNFAFFSCYSLTDIDFSAINTSNVECMWELLTGYNAIIELDLSSWDVSKVYDMDELLAHSPYLTQLNISNWDLRRLEYRSGMFYNCYSLNTVIMNNSNCVSVNKIIEQLPDRIEDEPGVLIIDGIDDINQVDASSAQTKNWNIVNESETSEFILGKSKLGINKL